MHSQKPLKCLLQKCSFNKTLRFLNFFWSPFFTCLHQNWNFIFSFVSFNCYVSWTSLYNFLKTLVCALNPGDLWLLGCFVMVVDFSRLKSVSGRTTPFLATTWWNFNESEGFREALLITGGTVKPDHNHLSGGARLCREI